jgi:hypothetical protein
VVSAVTEQGIVRGIAHFTSHKEILREVEKAVGVLTEVAEWAKAEYRHPTYFQAIGGAKAWDVLRGVYIWRWDASYMEKYAWADWRDPTNRYTVKIPELLFIPTGWGGQRDAQ